MSSQRENLSGRRFGKLVVGACLGIPAGAKWKTTKWTALCDCGKTKNVNAGDLKAGKTTSCGCVQKVAAQRIAAERRKDLTGERFGLLVVLEYVGALYTKWRVRCDCGEVREIAASSLVSGNSTSCGCRKTAAGKARWAALAAAMQSSVTTETV